jgi:P-type Ca2+ transporter type 2C
MDKDIGEPLIKDLGNFKYTPKELADIVILDNHYKDEKNEEHPGRILSSAMIIEKFSGPAAIA